RLWRLDEGVARTPRRRGPGRSAAHPEERSTLSRRHLVLVAEENGRRGRPGSGYDAAVSSPDRLRHIRQPRPGLVEALLHPSLPLLVAGLVGVVAAGAWAQDAGDRLCLALDAGHAFAAAGRQFGGRFGHDRSATGSVDDLARGCPARPRPGRLACQSRIV